MATGRDLELMLRSVRKSIQTNCPKQVAESMLKETKDNFAKEQYGNDGAAKRWPDRYGRIAGKKVNAEQYLNYPKLNYSGKLKRSARKSWGKSSMGNSYAAVSFSIPYAKDHNEGTLSKGGYTWRRPPKSKMAIKIGANPVKRQFAGVGSRTIKNVIRIYSREIRKLI